MNSRIRAIAKKEVIQLVHEPRTLAMVFVVPVVMVLIFGYVAGADIQNIKFAVVDHDQTQVSREMIAKIEHSRFFINRGQLATDAEIGSMLDAGEIKIGLVIPRGFQRDMDQHSQPQVQVVIDGTDSNTATIAQNYFLSIINSFRQNISKAAILKSGSGQSLTAPIHFMYRVYYNPEEIIC